jgi:tRNA (adenine22-N1)-methyltransferase
MILGERLRMVADLVGDFRRLADIGSDHAYLPVWLVLQGKADFVIAGEIQQGPLEAAQRTINEMALEDCIEVRLGDGLAVVRSGEIDAVVIAGMGGASIRGILERSPQIVNNLSRVVCQPMTGAAGLRRWLMEHDWLIDAEELVSEDGRLYEMFAARPGKIALPDDLLLEVGPLLWQNRHPLLPIQIERLLQQYQLRVDAMQHSVAPAVAAQKQLWQQKIIQLEAMRTCL